MFDVYVIIDPMEPIEQKQIEFQGRDITAVLVQDANGREQIYIPLKPIVEGLGLSWPGQYDRVKRSTILNEVCTTIRVTRIDIIETVEMLSIPINYLNGFLFGISEKRVKEEFRGALLEYQRQCYEVLFNAFNGTDSMIRFYEAIGHEGKWIKARIEKHHYSTKLNDVWLIHGVAVEDHPHLQDVINKGTFGLTVAEHKEFKRIPEDEMLQDHMSGAELLISALTDEAAYQATLNHDPQSLEEHEAIAKGAGDYGRKVAKGFEEQTGSKVLSDKNHLDKKRPSLPDGDTPETS